jgi:hypothetical protein
MKARVRRVKRRDKKTILKKGEQCACHPIRPKHQVSFKGRQRLFLIKFDQISYLARLRF